MTYASHLINRLSSVIGGKTPIEIWSGKSASDYDMLRAFGCPTYNHVSDRKLEPRAKKAVFLGFKRGVKGYKLWDFEDQKIVLSRDVTFDESSSVKSSSSQQVECGQTKGISQRVKRDASSPSPDSFVSFRVSSIVTQYTHHVQKEKDTKDLIEDPDQVRFRILL